MKSPTISLADTDDAQEWDRVVRCCSSGSVYHLFAWREVYQKASKPYYFVARVQGKIVGVLPVVQVEQKGLRKLVSLPQGVGGLCISEKVEEKGSIASELIQAAVKKAEAHDCHQVEIKTDVCHSELYKNWKRTRYALGYRVPVTGGWDSVWNNVLNKKARKNVRRALNAGCITKLYAGSDITDEVLNQFYEIHKAVSERLAEEAIGFEIILGIRTLLEDKCHICMTYYQNLPVAVRLFLADTVMGSVWMYMGASKSDYWKYNPNDLGYADTIRWSTENHYQWVDLGFSPYPSEKSGHAHFKRRWGGEEYKIDLFQYDLKPFVLLVKRALRKMHSLRKGGA